MNKLEKELWKIVESIEAGDSVEVSISSRPNEWQEAHANLSNWAWKHRYSEAKDYSVFLNDDYTTITIKKAGEVVPEPEVVIPDPEPEPEPEPEPVVPEDVVVPEPEEETPEKEEKKKPWWNLNEKDKEV